MLKFIIMESGVQFVMILMIMITHGYVPDVACHQLGYTGGDYSTGSEYQSVCMLL